MTVRKRNDSQTDEPMDENGRESVVSSSDVDVAVQEPRSVCILRTFDDHTFELDEKALEEILLQPDLRNKKVAVVSVAGAFRKGKSFLLNFFIRYLERKGDEEQWIGEEAEALKGFSWRGGAERETTGVLLWSKPYICQTPSGEKVAVLLMDTQGAFDSSSTIKECATVFALSTMVSSVQVYNLSSNIQEDHLQYLQLFTEYGRLALQESDNKPFQRLEFLLRDWSYPYEYPYGDGQKLLDRRLRVESGQHEELKQVRQHINACFQKIGCFLLPHPGKIVATNPKFDGKLQDIDEEFKEYLQQFVPGILSPDNLLIKNINGSDVTCMGLVEYFKSYMKIYEGGDLPEPKSMLQATAEANNLAALATAKDQYNKDMELICGGDTPYVSPAELETKHDRVQASALTLFRATRKMGGETFSREFEDRLETELAEQYEKFIKLNDSKNIFNSARTPAVFLTLMFMTYFLSGFFTMLGAYSFANMFNICLGLFLICIVLWAYIRFSGELIEIGQQLDAAAEWIWDEIFMKLYGYAVQQGTQAILNRQQSTKKKK
eukprot:gene19955-21909_t